MLSDAMTDPALRASDADREAVADRLRTAAVEGRLDDEELEARVAEAYSAKTHGELARVADDLPPLPAAPAPKAPVLADHRMRERLAGFIVANSTCIAIWAASGADGGFWPIWVLLGTGVGLFSSLVRRGLGVENHGRRRDRDRDRNRRRR